ncbi:MAG: hypothetical protein ACYCW5_01505 [Thermoleophilia bacterium]
MSIPIIVSIPAISSTSVVTRGPIIPTNPELAAATNASSKL